MDIKTNSMIEYNAALRAAHAAYVVAGANPPAPAAAPAPAPAPAPMAAGGRLDLVWACQQLSQMPTAMRSALGVYVRHANSGAVSRDRLQQEALRRNATNPHLRALWDSRLREQTTADTDPDTTTTGTVEPELARCDVCLEDLPTPRFISLLPCRHTLCGTCYQSIFVAGSASKCHLCCTSVEHALHATATCLPRLTLL